MKNIAIIGVITTIGIVAFFIIRPQIEPEFFINKLDNLKKEGDFSFGGNLNSFGINKSGSASARNGYVIQHGNRNNTLYFDLYRNGKFIRTLKTIG